jgi:F-type H+-transporting ATPase subunit a
LAGPAWFTFGIGIYVFEIIVSVVQAYIFTLLAAVYIQSSLHPDH